MKKLLSLLVCLCLATACGQTPASAPAGPASAGSGAVASSGAPGSAASSVPVAAGPAGYWQDRRYINEEVGIHFTLPGEWTRYSDGQLAALTAEVQQEYPEAQVILMATEAAGSNVMIMLYALEPEEWESGLTFEEMFPLDYEEGDLDTGIEGVTADPPYYYDLEGTRYYVLDVHYKNSMTQRTMYGFANGYMVNITVTATVTGMGADTIMKYFG